MAATTVPADFHQPQVQNIWTFCGCTPPAPPPLWCCCSPPCVASGHGTAHHLRRIPSQLVYSVEPVHKVSAHEYSIKFVYLQPRISPRFLLKIRKGPNGILRGLGETNQEKKKLKSKISWHCPFKETSKKMTFKALNTGEAPAIPLHPVKRWTLRHQRWISWLFLCQGAVSPRPLVCSPWVRLKRYTVW